VSSNDPRVADWVRGASIAVVGGFGLLGRALLSRLAAYGAASAVVVEPRPATAAAPLRVEHRSGDVRDPASLRSALAGCSVAFHLAALKSAPDSVDAPLTYFAVNALGTANVLEACRLESVRALVYASTSHVYGVPERIPVPESHPTRPLSIYAASKLAGETIALSYGSAYGIDARVVRMANLYGGVADPSTVVGRAVSQAVAGEPIRLRNLDSVRDLLYVDDAADGLLRIAAAAARPEASVVNLSNAQGVSTGRMAELVADAVAARGATRPPLVRPEPPAQEAVPRLVLSNERLLALTGWVPPTDLGAGLKHLVDSHLERKRVNG
jgi:nucleoside-diphosphate-sugar epimerase